MDPTLFGASVTAAATVLVAVLGYGATRQAARRADDLDRLRALADRQDTVITQRDAEIARKDAEIIRLRGVITRLEEVDEVDER